MAEIVLDRKSRAKGGDCSSSYSRIIPGLDRLVTGKCYSMHASAISMIVIKRVVLRTAIVLEKH